MDVELSRADLGRIGDKLGAGGQAVVYRLPDLRLPDDRRELAYKEYRPGHAPPVGMKAIVSKRTGLTATNRAKLDSIAVWPVRAVRDGDRNCGVVLPVIPAEFFQSRRLPGSGASSRDPREVQNLFVAPSLAERVGMPLVPLKHRYAICRDLADALAFLHRHGVVFGDINAKNVLFRKATRATVMLVDCDAVRFRGSAAVTRQLNAPDWEPPEGGGVLTEATDLFKLGLAVLRVLNPGAQASTSRDPRRADPLLTIGKGRELLRAALSADPRQRPAAVQWRNYFADLAGMEPTELLRRLS
ncbi:protein kinase [Virgisporangium aurantiacum]|nr:protein kinase [Virgisporangium aurantiacum]